MKKLIPVLSLFVFALALWPAQASAGRLCRFMGKRFMRKLPKETRLKIMGLRLSIKRQGLLIKAAMKTVKIKLKLAITAAQPDMDKIKELIAEKFKEKKKLALLKVKFLIKVQTFLKGENLLRFRLKMLKGRKGKRGKRFRKHRFRRRHR